MLIRKVQTDHFSVASGVWMGGGRSSVLIPQRLGKLQPLLPVYLRTCTKENKHGKDTTRQDMQRSSEDEEREVLK